MATYEDGVAYACAPMKDEKGWRFCQQAFHEKDVLGDDGARVGRITVSEGAGLRYAVDTGRSPEGGLWLGGSKYLTLQHDEINFEVAGLGSIKILTCIAEKREDLVTEPYRRLIGHRQGVHIVRVGSQIVAGFFDEAKGQLANK